MDLKPDTFHSGDITARYGLYKVVHSIEHYPPSQTFIDRGLTLPYCHITGCEVTFHLISLISWKDVPNDYSRAKNQPATGAIHASK